MLGLLPAGRRRQDLRQKRKLLRVAEEADRAAEWRMGLPKLVANGR